MTAGVKIENGLRDLDHTFLGVVCYP